jgi:hypothetical protein
MVTITFFMVSSSFSAFFLDIIEEDYNTDTPLAFHPLKSAFAACSCDFIFFWLGLQVVWAIAPWIRVPEICRGLPRKFLNKLKKRRRVGRKKNEENGAALPMSDVQ